MNDKEFLHWIHDRLKRYGENPKQDFMVRLRSIVTAECLKNDAVAEALAKEAKRELLTRQSVNVNSRTNIERDHE